MSAELLGAKQRRFALDFAKFVVWIYEQGLAITIGEGLRSNEQAEINAMGPVGRAGLVLFLSARYPDLALKIKDNTGSGIRNTLHEMKLAQDFNLWRQAADGSWQWLASGTEPEWELIGRKWESMGPEHCWGGRFSDANHFSIAHDGRK